jgi:hypothetical protein
LRYKLIKCILKNWTPNLQATMAIDVMKKNQLMIFTVKIMFIAWILRKNKYNFLSKCLDVTVGSPYSRHWLQLLKTAIPYVLTEHRWLTHHDCFPLICPVQSQASNLSYSVRNWIAIINLDHCSINHHAPAVPSVYSFMISQQMHICKYVQPHTIILHQHVSVTPVTVIRMSYNKNAIIIQIIVQTC